MIIVGVNRSKHDGSVCLMKNNEVIFHIHSERLSNIKHDSFVFSALNKIKDYTDHIDILALSGTYETIPYDKLKIQDAYTAAVMGLGKTFVDHDFIIYDMWNNHHEIHAATAFYNSGFNSALCIVKDGAGSKFFINDELSADEITTSFIASYPNNFLLLDKQLSNINNILPKNNIFQIEHNAVIVNSCSDGAAYESTALGMGMKCFDSGKVMGMSAYGKPNKNFNNLYVNGYPNSEIFFGNFDEKQQIYKVNLPEDFESRADFSYSLQKSMEKNVLNYILLMLEKSGEKNLCLSGGLFLNCLSNYNILKNIPKDVKIYIEPMSDDAGNGYGAAKYAYYLHSQSKEIKKQNTIYYGFKYNYTLKNLKNEKLIKNVKPEFVAKLISEKNIVALYQGRSEAGPRALGNRSILYDPRDINGKDHVNIVKKREWYRPFAGTVLKEYAKDWFDLQTLEESKFMMFAVQVLKNKQDLIPAITHIDGSCRVQTIDRIDNKHYYDLIKAFYNITSVPILFNTSFNLAGNSIAETLEDALWTLHNSEINYLYLPELSVLVYK